MKKLEHIKTLANAFDVQRKVHRHVCLSVTFKDQISPHPLYWRLDDPKFNLIEIGIEPYTGQLLSFTVANYNGRISPLESVAESYSRPSNDGIPCFNTDLWQTDRDADDVSANFYDVPGRCRILLGVQRLRVELFPDQISYNLKTDHFVCEFNEAKELCAISVTNLTPNEVNKLMQSIGTDT